MHSILDGVDNHIDTALNVRHIGTKAPHYAHKSGALIAGRPDSFNATTLLRKIGDRIVKNWRWKKKDGLCPENASKEKILEKRIANIMNKNWVNQMPTASGLLNSTGGKLHNIDLVHQISQSEYELI